MARGDTNIVSNYMNTLYQTKSSTSTPVFDFSDNPKLEKQFKTKLGRLFKSEIPFRDILAWWALQVGTTKTYIEKTKPL